LLRGLASTFSVVLVNSELLTHDGLPLVEQIRREHSTLPVVAISAAMRQQVLEGGTALAAVRRPITSQLDAAFARLRAKAASES
jgi:DNA-binding response OmpR family regulator